MRERLEDLFFVSLAFTFAGFGAWALFYTETERQSLRMENQSLRHHVFQLCQHIDSLPKQHRAVFEVCLENIRR